MADHTFGDTISTYVIHRWTLTGTEWENFRGTYDLASAEVLKRNQNRVDGAEWKFALSTVPNTVTHGTNCYA